MSDTRTVAEANIDKLNVTSIGFVVLFSVPDCTFRVHDVSQFDSVPKSLNQVPNQGSNERNIAITIVDSS